MEVLVTDGHTRAALAITRSLGSLGHSVRVGAPHQNSIAGTSRFCSGEHRTPSPASGIRASARALVRLIRDLRPDVVLGVTDSTLAVLHSVSGEIGETVLPPPNADAYLRASDKVLLVETCRRAGVRVPEGVIVLPGAAFPEDAVADLGTPVVVRPALSWRPHQDRWIRGPVTIEPGARAVRERMSSDPALAFPFLVQRRVDGEGCGLFVLALDGSLLRVFAHRRLREKPPSGGVSTLCEAVAPPDDLVDAARRWAQLSRWSGIAMLEFKRERGSGHPYLLEVNARPWGSMALAAAAGVDFPLDLLSLVTSGRVPEGNGYAAGVRMRWWWGDVDHFYLEGLAQGHRGVVAMARAAIRALRAGPWPDAWDTFRLNDPLPFVIETARWVGAGA